MKKNNPTVHITINGQEMDLTEKEAKDLLDSLTRYFEQQTKQSTDTDTLYQDVDAYVKSREAQNA